MFFQEDIQSVLQCTNCEGNFDVFIATARILPCFYTICQNCVINCLNKKNIIDCPICKSTHDYPINGFPLNQTIQQLLLQLKSKIIIDQRPKLKQLEDKLDLFHRYILNPQTMLKDMQAIVASNLFKKKAENDLWYEEIKANFDATVKDAETKIGSGSHLFLQGELDKFRISQKQIASAMRTIQLATVSYNAHEMNCALTELKVAEKGMYAQFSDLFYKLLPFSSEILYSFTNGTNIFDNHKYDQDE